MTRPLESLAFSSMLDVVMVVTPDCPGGLSTVAADCWLPMSSHILKKIQSLGDCGCRSIPMNTPFYFLLLYGIIYYLRTSVPALWQGAEPWSSSHFAMGISRNHHLSNLVHHSRFTAVAGLGLSSQADRPHANQPTVISIQLRSSHGSPKGWPPRNRTRDLHDRACV